MSKSASGPGPARRSLLRSALLAPAVAMTACAQESASPAQASPAPTGTGPAAAPSPVGAVPAGRLMPDEGARHTRTWMAFGPTARIWGADLLDEVRRNLADVARAIARFEPVSMLVRPTEFDLAADLLADAFDDGSVSLVESALDDLWVRDSGPTFTTGPGGLRAVDFNFNGWGGRQVHRADALVATKIAAVARVPRVRTDLVLEGGALEVDGEGTAIITESCVLNDNRNPGWTKADVEAELAALLGIRKVIWLPGIRDRDITDGHTDFYARFVRPGVVVAARDDDPASFDHAVTRRHLALLAQAKDAAGRRLQVHQLVAPVEIRQDYLTDDFAAGYVNFFVCNGAVVAPQFGDRRADAAAAATLRGLYPRRTVVQVAIDGIAAGGGGIHCATQQQPA